MGHEAAESETGESERGWTVKQECVSLAAAGRWAGRPWSCGCGWDLRSLPCHRYCVSIYSDTYLHIYISTQLLCVYQERGGGGLVCSLLTRTRKLRTFPPGFPVLVWAQELGTILSKVWHYAKCALTYPKYLWNWVAKAKVIRDERL